MPRRVMQGVVVSNKMQKTLVVRVERRTTHPLYRKIIKLSKKYAVHVERESDYQIGQTVSIQECAPISKNKTWQILSVANADGAAS
ncbi:MAG: 30S ribosomal protein S17 [Alphaproteobacteria bacterium]|nr:30S ribosomal protein S17 [Alphaproteobacteria bacterium]